MTTPNRPAAPSTPLLQQAQMQSAANRYGYLIRSQLSRLVQKATK